MTWTDVSIWAHPKSLPRAFGRPLDSRWLFYFLLCYTVLTRASQLETVVHGCRILLILGLVFIMSLSCYVFYAVRSALQKFEYFVEPEKYLNVTRKEVNTRTRQTQPVTQPYSPKRNFSAFLTSWFKRHFLRLFFAYFSLSLCGA